MCWPTTSSRSAPAAGFGLAVMVQIMVFPVFGLHPTLPQNLKIGLIFTATSLLRSYAIRRLFERWPAGGGQLGER